MVQLAEVPLLRVMVPVIVRPAVVDTSEPKTALPVPLGTNQFAMRQ
jgi:hypothetical protein